MPARSVIPAQAGIQRRRIAILGAGGTGKSWLAIQLAARLRDQGCNATAIPDILGEWRTRTGRMPGAEEQLAIAGEQEDRVDAAAAIADVVFADTTALMVAIHADATHEDNALYRFALARQRGYDATLVMGLDIARPSDHLQRDAVDVRDSIDLRESVDVRDSVDARDASATRESLDALLRGHLQRAAIPFHVVYGQGPQRLQSALQALAAGGVLPPQLRQGDEEGSARRPWVWACDKCSDPACEHRLFRRLRDAQP